MFVPNITPSSIESIKRLAKKWQKAEGLPYHKALDKASQIASYQNYAHAISKLNRVPTIRNAPHPLFLTVYWEDRRTHSHGRETLKISLTKPFLDICSKSEMKRTRELYLLRCAAEDHLVADGIANAQDSARELICKAVRSIRFMEATGLKPSKSADLRPLNKKHDSEPPRSDHVTTWIDPSARQLIMVDEPYLDPVVDEDRRTWATQRGWHLEASTWPGMYFPYNCALFVTTDASKGYDFGALMKKINSLPKPMIEENWAGSSANSHEVFISPQAKALPDMRRAKPKGTIFRVPSKKTVPMSLRSVNENNRKPNAVMPFPIHQEIGRTIKSLLTAGNLGDIAWSRMSSLRSQLENWLCTEHDERNFEEIDFLDVYYRGIDDDDPYVQLAQSKDGKVRMLGKINKLLKHHYPDCAPLKQALHRIDVSVKHLK
ncbi:DUF5623 domain-containing protein [Thalassospira xiamenensis]|uniref:DUF5623 domain-containing protein n=1 Tax=Thalassospira xiamenensis TaxID=220697 RepID=A0A285TPG7_9PROT|nr:DUF5623 domain-containing protein [Thalassospira xiamenensis]SOC24605.1 hypothetical protein SAMN05428964_104360 [Thalassospira xiamenensis]